ncbi:RdgB/HAM1 family non-canonical purine NTP pyrophosphatase [Dongia rigui]|uniref:dITP/XTP pyrophosphatase n=1 Tax=Dongia rigui TaxID=940149 RepID=A0ABU5DYY6_9PROT|nr:RdgB/HAM1 family non-canonical purine NTP pyrophosphatase [Dongia rigui]MDY0871863.1 RdgB/HAM1 family non-canonical purine NTP pyrophosphatase [Dongia rigui]
MARVFTGGKLVLASHNPGKLKEIAELLAPYKVDVVSAGALGLPEPEETEKTFIGNARLKAVAAATASGLPALADDSGLEVMALGRDPGIYSARWAGPTKDFAMAMAKVLDLLKGKSDRSARFVSALALAWPDGHCDEFEGDVWGQIVDAPKGTRGFGYDPIFRPDGYTETFGEMAPEKKHEMSHRAVAFRLFVEGCFRK